MNCIDFFQAHYLETRVQLTTDHVLCLGNNHGKDGTTNKDMKTLNLDKGQFSKIS